MITRIALAASAALLSLALATPAKAQVHFGVSAGASIPESSFGEEVNTGYNVNGMVNIGVPLSPLGFRAEVGWNRFDLSNANANGNIRLLNGAANVVLTPSAFMTAKPYLIAGVGMYNVKSTINANTGVLVDPFAKSSDTRPGFNGGIGLTFGFGAIGTMLEARYVTVNGKNGSGSLTYVPVTFGVTF